LRGLRQTKSRLPQIPSAKLNNFITDFNADPANSSRARALVMQAWMWLKSPPGPNTYAEYCKIKSAQQAMAETLIENTGLPRRQA
jgi:hypothetical protein